MKGTSILSTIARIVVAGLLFFALKRHTYSYFTILRWIVFGVGLYLTIMAFRKEALGWGLTLGIMALVFNPFVPVRLDRNTWAIVDGAAGILILASVFFVQEKKKS